jgi:zinc transport system permease protein
VIEAFSTPFFQRVMIAALLASVACGVIGSYIVAKRISSLCGGLAHAAFGGVGLGYLVGFSPMLGAAGAGLLASAIIGTAYRRLGSSLDTVIAIVWSVGMALGVLFVALAPGYTPDLTSYLFGSLLLVPWDYVALVGALDLLVVGVAWLLHKELQAVAFDEEFAEVSGLPVEPLFLLLLGLSALSIVTLIRVVGIILAIALLTVPAVIARQWRSTLGPIMGLAIAICAASLVAGLLGSWQLSAGGGPSLPPGPLAILCLAVAYAGSSALRRLRA